MRLDEILHHLLEPAVAGLAVLLHHHSQHVQDVSALGIDQTARDTAGLAAVETIALRHWSNCVRLAIFSRRRSLDNLSSKLFPEVDEALVAANDLHVK